MKGSFVVLFVFITSLCYSQYIPPVNLKEVQSQVASVQSLLEGVDTIAEKSILYSEIRHLKEITDCYYYRNLWDQAMNENDKEKKIFLFQEVSFIEYYLFQDVKLCRQARLLYQEAMKQIINLYSGNLEALNEIQVHPGCRAIVYPFLKIQIIAAGGVWDRGELPQVNIKVTK